MTETIKKAIKKIAWRFYAYHHILYTILILCIGVAIGCMYDGQGEDGTHYFHIFGHTIYIGFIL